MLRTFIHRYITSSMSALLLLTSLVACGNSKKKSAASNNIVRPELSYHIQGEYRGKADDDRLLVYTDHHSHMAVDTLQIVKGQFEWQGKTADIAEICIVTPRKKHLRMYAHGGMQGRIVIDSLDRLFFVDADTLNRPLEQYKAQIDTALLSIRRDMIDSICRTLPASFVSSLLLRDRLESVSDSLLARRCLGHLSWEVKPHWFVEQINDIMDRGWKLHNKSRRLKSFDFTAADSAVVSVNSQTPNSTILYFWADYDEKSVKQLQSLDSIARSAGLYKYEKEFVQKKKKTKRLRILTFCLHAADSAAWRKTIRQIPGEHIWLKEGWNHPAVQEWDVEQLPGLLLIDRYAQVQERNIFSTELNKKVERLPEKSTTTNALPKKIDEKTKVLPKR